MLKDVYLLLKKNELVFCDLSFTNKKTKNYCNVKNSSKI